MAFGHKHPLVIYKIAKTNEVGKWSFNQLFRTLILSLFLMVRPMMILHTFMAAPSCITTTMSSEKSTSSSRSLSTSDGPWSFSLEAKMNLNLLPRGVFNGEMVVTNVKVIILLFYTCFELEVFAVAIVRSSRTT